jgi:hypothetical protein
VRSCSITARAGDNTVIIGPVGVGQTFLALVRVISIERWPTSLRAEPEEKRPSS